ncbi:type 1 glutamine amidotransferase [Paraburkholderia fungorum]|uniref:type 1 glutamine amidotransferase n=1 Tax=Paraburkholderia fungorum TaxID=134537 RepID=UPI0004851560|nr:type 1 glutamine amidotransferase [Paraburkholderia fungorum]MBB5542438.1 GMP synthase (glutamine-hydrolyzing) [Paraburkholderia fungorum]PNE57696.1 type 1 glutamine amidotransferase [Paraburkholderia fungorum]
MKKYAVIWCTNFPEDEPLKARMIAAFSRENEQWDLLRPESDDFLERVFNYAGHVISGSPQSVVDDADTPLVRNLLEFIRAADSRGDIPVIGLCFGSQAIAAALGGRVERNPSGRFKLGVDRLNWSEEAHALLGDSIAAVPSVLVQSHGECVASLPPDSVHLASSETILNEVFLVKDQFLGIQGHPEVDSLFLQQKFMVYHRSLFDEVQWERVECESKQPLEPARVIALGRRLLDEGRLSKHGAEAKAEFASPVRMNQESKELS